MIKFLPLLGGLALIHEYSQTKMSRIDGDSRGYEEFNYEYGYAFDEENNFKTRNYEFLLDEPDVLINIHFYIIECLLCNLDNIGVFVFNKKQKIYFSEEVIKLINRQILSHLKKTQFTEICQNKQALHQILEKIINSLYEEYIQINAQEEQSKESALVKKQENEGTNLNRSFYLSYPDSLYISKKLTLSTIFNSGQLDQYINPNDISLDLSEEEENFMTENIYQNLRQNNQFNQTNDPYFYYRYHYAHASPESIQLMDLLNDNVIPSQNEILINYSKQNIIKNKFPYMESHDLGSLNVTDLSSGMNLSRNNSIYPLNRYITNYYNNNLNQINLNNQIGENNFYNMSSNSSQIRPFLKMK